MPFTGSEDHSIALQDAVELTKNYRESVGKGSFLGGYVSRNAALLILNQVGCTGIRIYNAKDNSGNLTFVLVGVNSEGEDLTGGELAEFVSQCPPYCPEASQLAGSG